MLLIKLRVLLVFSYYKKMKQILFFNFPKSSELLDDTLAKLEGYPDIEVTCIATPIEATQFLLSSSNCIVILHATNKMDLIQSNVVLKKLNKSIRENIVIPLAITELAKSEYTENLKIHYCPRLLPKNVTTDKLVEKIVSLKSIKNLDLDKDMHSNDFHLIGEPESCRDLVYTELDSGVLTMGIKCNESLAPCNLEYFCLEQIECEVIDSDIMINLVDKVEVSINFKYGNSSIELKLEGTVSGIEVFENRNKVIAIDLDSADNLDLDLDNFMSLYQKRQTSIHDFMKLAKGY